METLILDWATLLARWLHVIFGIAWIGASFYFIWLDLSLEAPSDAKSRQGLGGELWAIHGGGIYEVGKYRLGPPTLPARLHWFKWEAYSTWLSGIALMTLLYYLQPTNYLIGAEAWFETPAAAIGGSIAFLLAGLVLYEGIMRTPLAARPVLAAGVGMAVLVGVSALAFAAFSPRAAILHVGALLGTIMAGNVFLNIIPAQRALVGALERGVAPDAPRALAAKLRSTHNNYFTLPVLFCMVGSHASFVYATPHAWLFVPAFGVTAAVARHYFNLRHQGRPRPAVLVIAGAAFVALATLVAIDGGALRGTGDRAALDAGRVGQIVVERCAGCHSQTPTFPGYPTPPGGLVFARLDDLERHGGEVAASLRTAFMPLGNLTGMTTEERDLLLAWVDAGQAPAGG